MSMYVSGGIGSNRQFYELRQLPTGKYRQIIRKPLYQPREYHSMCWLDDTKLFFTGSRVANLETEVEYYDFEQKDMISTGKMNQGRSRHASVGFEDYYIYVFGGFGVDVDQPVVKDEPPKQVPLKTIERFSLEENGSQWMQIVVQQGREFSCIDASAVQINSD